MFQICIWTHEGRNVKNCRWCRKGTVQSVKVLKGLVSRCNRWEMSVSQFMGPACPSRVPVASGHSALTLGMVCWKKKKMRGEPDASSHSASCIHLKIIGEAPFHSQREAHKRVIAYSKTTQVCRFNFGTQSLWGFVSPTTRKSFGKVRFDPKPSDETLLHVNFEEVNLKDNV